jgi:hypothetical protein
MAFAFVNGIMQSIAKPFYEKNVEVYLLFKQINKDNYIPSIRVSHWQVICHFINDNRYMCYELQTDNGDKGGIITYQISNFSYDGYIYYYYIGACNASEGVLKEKCEKISINNLKYILGFRDCQSWATLLIESLGLSIIDAGPLLLRILRLPPNFPRTSLAADHFVMDSSKVPDDTEAAYESLLNYLLCGIKQCHGYKNLEPKPLTLKITPVLPRGNCL